MDLNSINAGNQKPISIGDSVNILGYPNRIRGRVIGIKEISIHNIVTEFRSTFRVAEIQWDGSVSYIWVNNLEKIK